MKVVLVIIVSKGDLYIAGSLFAPSQIKIAYLLISNEGHQVCSTTTYHHQKPASIHCRRQALVVSDKLVRHNGT